MKYIPPSTAETAFNCPHCDALAKQFWFSVRADRLDDERPLPRVLRDSDQEDWEFSDIEDDEMRTKLVDWANRMKGGLPFFETGKNGSYNFQSLHNVSVSKCYNCKDISLWIFDRLIYPRKGEAPPANPDLPVEIRRDYEEASSVLDLSPRGASALIRLCIQKLCMELGQPGKNINSDIAALVASGLDPKVQRALDAVRVIGNNAVHPGKIDLQDDRATAESLFRLTNLIVEKMISEPKHVDEVYASLPTGALEAIERRDKNS